MTLKENQSTFQIQTRRIQSTLAKMEFHKFLNLAKMEFHKFLNFCKKWNS